MHRDQIWKNDRQIDQNRGQKKRNYMTNGDLESLIGVMKLHVFVSVYIKPIMQTTSILASLRYLTAQRVC